MDRLIDLTLISKHFNNIYDNTEFHTVDLSEARFHYINTDTPFISYGGYKFLITSDWVKKQLCKLIGVSEKFYNRSPEDLSEENLNTHSQFLKENQTKVVFVTVKTKEPLEFVMRGIISEDYLQLSNLQVIKEVVNHLDEYNIKGIRDLSGVDAFSQDWNGIVVSNYSIDLQGNSWNRGYFITGSELGSSKLVITPALYNHDKDLFLILQRSRNGKFILEVKYESPKNGTLMPQIRDSLAVSDTLFNGCLQEVSEAFSQEFEDQQSLYDLLADWETRKNISNSVIGKVRKTLDTQDSEEYTSRLGELCELFVEEGLKGNLNVALKTSGYVSDKLGFSG